METWDRVFKMYEKVIIVFLFLLFLGIIIINLVYPFLFVYLSIDLHLNDVSNCRRLQISSKRSRSSGLPTGYVSSVLD